MHIITGILQECFILLNDMSPYLLFGFLFAGILKVFIPQNKIISFLGKGNIRSVVNASLLGIPLPLCSCGVIPAAISLKKHGASKGATLSFLISTPTTGIDSILATYGLLGGLFTIFRVVTSFVAAILCGSLANIFSQKQEFNNRCFSDSICNSCREERKHSYRVLEQLVSIFRYAFVELIEDIGGWLIVGIVIGGVIAYAVPQSLISRYLGSDLLSMVIMVLVGIPLYVCATGSIPIAAALMLKGLSPGGALVFLLCGPATNTVTITVIAKELGKKEAFIYLFTIIVVALIAGFFLNSMWYSHKELQYLPGARMLPLWITRGSSIILICLLGFSFIKKEFIKRKERIMKTKDNFFVLYVPDMSCKHCVNNIKQALEGLAIYDAVIDLKNKKIILDNSLLSRREEIISSISAAGYKVEEMR